MTDSTSVEVPGQVVEVKVEFIGGGVTVSNPPFIQVSIYQIREHLDEIGRVAAAGGVVRIIDHHGLPIRELPEDVAALIESLRLNHEAQRAAATVKDEADESK